MTTAKRLRIGLGALGVATLGYGVYGLFEESGIRDETAVGEWLIGGVIWHDFLLAPVVFALGAIAYRFTDARWRGRLAAVLLIGGSLTLISIPALLRQGLNRNTTVLPLDYARNLGVLLAVLVALVAAYAGVVRFWRSLRPVVVEDGEEEAGGERKDHQGAGEEEAAGGEIEVDEVVQDEAAEQAAAEQAAVKQAAVREEAVPEAAVPEEAVEQEEAQDT
ncbi:hypothetical protein KDK95_05480 [Actinospica sp. MGRD01-02]|uniref:Uncharacterized protein n=1 Tax=Actinospica acidithermotolerans TaxID=2828514 RepID=A0A941IEY6_9ACTN|nr:hypothetical protein [Actinospica acidithermotolerans]MBR7825750.1 hypothetical protein [Actinospica acidithermotolerans]